MSIANVALNDTFDYWRTVTNSMVVALNENLLYFKTANANTISLTASGGSQSNIYMNVITTSSYTDVSSANIASTLAVNAVHGLAYSWVGAANSNAQISVASSNTWTNTVAAAVNSYVLTVTTAGNNYASVLVSNNSIGANAWSNTKLSNTAGISLVGNFNLPTGNLGIGTSSTANGIASLSILRTSTALSGSSNPYGLYAYPTAAGATYIDAITNSSSNTTLSLRTYTNGTYSETRMTETGNLGLGTNSPAHKLDVVGTGRASVDFRAPVFYDSNNTGYYAVPSGSSNFYALTLQNQLNCAGPIYGTILYDYNNNGYYVDPSSRSNILALTLAVGNWIQSSDTYNRIYFTNTGSTYLLGSATGDYWIRFGTQDNQTRAIFEGAGNFYTIGNVTAYWSDRRLKKNIEKISDWRDIINGINGYRFEWNETGNKLLENSEPGVQVGLIAQEVEQVLPQAAAVQMMQYKDKEGDVLTPRDDINYDPENPYLTVREEKIIPVLVEAIKGLMAEIDDLKKRLP